MLRLIVASTSPVSLEAAVQSGDVDAVRLAVESGLHIAYAHVCMAEIVRLLLELPLGHFEMQVSAGIWKLCACSLNFRWKEELILQCTTIQRFVVHV
jgi:hypothetical protein